MKKDVKKYVQNYWKCYIDGTFVYIFIPKIYLEEIKEKGLNPKKLWLKKEDLMRFWLSVERIYRNNFEPLNFSEITPLLRADSLEFSSKQNPPQAFLQINELTRKILESTTLNLSKEEIKLIKKLHKQSETLKERETFKIRLSSFKEAKIKYEDRKEEIEILGPYSSFKNKLLKSIPKPAKEVTIADVEIALEKYHPFLVCKKSFSITTGKKLDKRAFLEIYWKKDLV
ncbi:MAG: hypothetical protein V2A62_05445 [Candidatus Woesearchaeota archaeon]